LYYPLEVILVRVRCSEACPLRVRNLEETLDERSMDADQSTVHRWVISRYLGGKGVSQTQGQWAGAGRWFLSIDRKVGTFLNKHYIARTVATLLDLGDAG
jgi:hypothetical protein